MQEAIPINNFTTTIPPWENIGYILCGTLGDPWMCKSSTMLGWNAGMAIDKLTQSSICDSSSKKQNL
jgi:hypothetical protein